MITNWETFRMGRNKISHETLLSMNAIQPNRPIDDPTRAAQRAETQPIPWEKSRTGEAHRDGSHLSFRAFRRSTLKQAISTTSRIVKQAKIARSRGLLPLALPFPMADSLKQTVKPMTRSAPRIDPHAHIPTGASPEGSWSFSAGSRLRWRICSCSFTKQSE